MMLSLRHVRVISRLVQFRQPKACYIPTKRIIKQGSKETREDKALMKEAGPELHDLLDDFEAFASDFGKDPAMFKAERKREEDQRKRFVKNKIIEKKYFRPPQEINLLTWAAKEQIRFLHHEFPDEWTLENLAESFPISKEGLIKLLKSTFVPRDLKALYKHDFKVKENWLAIKDGSAESGGPLATKYQDLIASGKLRLLSNAAGNTSLPMPEQQLLASGKDLLAESNRRVGQFELIVKDYVEKKKAKEVAVSSGRELDVAHQTEEIRSLLLSFVPADRSNGLATHGRMFRFIQDRPSNKQMKLLDAKYERQHQKKTHNFKHKFSNAAESVPPPDAEGQQFDLNTVPYASGHEICDLGTEFETVPESLTQVSGVTLSSMSRESSHGSDSYQKRADNVHERRGRRGRGRTARRIKLSELNSEELLKYQMEGTEKLDAVVPLEDFPLEDLEDIDSKPLKFADLTDSAPGIEKQIKFGSRSVGKESDSGVKDAYMYSDETGYQYPYGRSDESYRPVKIDEKLKRPGRIFKKDNVYYDEEGEFLYRTP